MSLWCLTRQHVDYFHSTPLSRLLNLRILSSVHRSAGLHHHSRRRNPSCHQSHSNTHSRITSFRQHAHTSRKHLLATTLLPIIYLHTSERGQAAQLNWSMGNQLSVHNSIFENYSSSSRAAVMLFGAFFGLFGNSEEEDDPTKVPPSVKRHLLKAQRYRLNGNHHGAVNSCHKALKILATSKHASSQAYVEGRAYVLDALANIYLEQGQLEKAEVNFKETMKIMLSLGMEQDSEAMIEISLKLAKVYSNQRRYPLAGEGFIWCRDKAREKWQTTPSPESHALLGMCTHSLGQYYLIVGDHNEATLAFREALDIARQVYGENDLQVGVMLNDLGTALDAQGLFTEAEKTVMKSLEIVKLNDYVDGIHEHLAIVECNLAEIQSHLGNNKAAMDSCKRAVAFARKVDDKLLSQSIERKCSNNNSIG